MIPLHIFKNVVEDLIPFQKFLGFKLLEVREGFVSLLIPARPELIGDPRINRIHGGVLATAMDCAGGAVGFTTLTSFEDKISTIDLRVDYLRPGVLEDIIADAWLVRNGSSVVFTDMKAYHPARPDEILATGKGVFSVKRVKLEE